MLLLGIKPPKMTSQTYLKLYYSTTNRVDHLAALQLSGIKNNNCVYGRGGVMAAIRG